VHMGDEVLSLSVAAAFLAVSALGLAGAARAASRAFPDTKVPLMGVLGAFVFAAQMVNFPVLSGTSGHLGGGVLLAILLGPHAAALVMAAILVVQALVFRDGGLLALGCNTFNMGLAAPYLGYAAYRAVIGRPNGPKATGRLYLATFAGGLVGVVASAAFVPVQIALSGRSAVPFPTFFSVMVGVHLLIGAVEGLITFAVVLYVAQVRPDTLAVRIAGRERVSRRALAASFGLFALVTAGFLSLVASGLPDGLEWLAAEKGYAVPADLARGTDPTMARASDWQERVAPLPDYSVRGESAPKYWTSIAGILGTLATLGIVYGIAAAVRRRRPAGHGHA